MTTWNLSKIQSLLGNNSHSRIQLQHFVVGVNGITLYGQLIQCLRELHSRWFTKIRAELDVEDAEDYIKECKNKEDGTRKTINNTKRAELSLLEAKENLKNVEFEFQQLTQIADTLISLGAAPKDEEHKQQLEMEYWKSKFINDIQSNNVSRQIGVAPSLIQAIMSLPTEQQKYILNSLNTDIIPKQINKE